MTRPVASIIVPVYNRSGELFHLLCQLAAQTRTDFEVVVVDDGSDPPVREDMLSQPPPYDLAVLRRESRGGAGRARNAGIAAARADLLIFVDSDGDMPDTRWFENHLALHAQGQALARETGGELCVVHSEVRGISGTWWGRVDTYSNWFGSCGSAPRQIKDRHVPTHNTSAARQVFEAAGLFDEELEVCEDVEWALRCLEKGVSIYYLPGASVRHRDRDTFREVWRHYERFGYFAPLVRRKRNRAAYTWLFPRGPVSAAALFLPLTVLMTAYVLGCWLPRKPGVIVCLPGLYLANVAYYAGLCRRLFSE